MMVIAATRMYRSLTQFGPSDLRDVNLSFLDANCGQYQFSSQTPASRTEPRIRPISDEPISPNEMELTVHTYSELYPDSYISKDEQLYDKHQGPAVGGDVESGGER